MRCASWRCSSSSCFSLVGMGAGDIDKLITDARQQREKGNNSAAIIQLKNVLQKSPENAEARYLLGLIYNDTGDFSSAEKELGRALELRYDPTKVIPPLVKSLLMRREFQKVLDQTRIEGDAPNLVQAEILTLRGLASLGRAEAGKDASCLSKRLSSSRNSPMRCSGRRDWRRARRNRTKLRA